MVAASATNPPTMAALARCRIAAALAAAEAMLVLGLVLGLAVKPAVDWGSRQQRRPSTTAERRAVRAIYQEEAPECGGRLLLLPLLAAVEGATTAAAGLGWWYRRLLLLLLLPSMGEGGLGDAMMMVVGLEAPTCRIGWVNGLYRRSTLHTCTFTSHVEPRSAA